MCQDWSSSVEFADVQDTIPAFTMLMDLTVMGILCQQEYRVVGQCVRLGLPQFTPRRLSRAPRCMGDPAALEGF